MNAELKKEKMREGGYKRDANLQPAKMQIPRYSIRLKINISIEFKICPTKNANFDPPTIKDKTI